MKIMRIPQRGRWWERAYSTAVHAIQSSFVQAHVKLDAKFQVPKSRQPTVSLIEKLQGLGLATERIRWTPLTIKPHKLELLYDQITAQPPHAVLELGCGVSTALLAALAQRHQFSLLSLENHNSAPDFVRYLLQGHPALSQVTIQLCGFVRRPAPNGKHYWCYDAELTAYPNYFDMVLIDAPMKQLAGRFGTLYQLIPYLQRPTRIYLDDSERLHEQQCIAAWQQDYPDLQADTFVGYPDITCLQLI